MMSTIDTFDMQKPQMDKSKKSHNKFFSNDYYYLQFQDELIMLQRRVKLFLETKRPYNCNNFYNTNFSTSDRETLPTEVITTEVDEHIPQTNKYFYTQTSLISVKKG